ncbi:MAG TPA: tRNA pseudouridine(55) synthase TruB [Terriglobia bacterium]|nr:tRNA pseudouridine(55) synthase TruB [Terriglobia bacterium]
MNGVIVVDKPSGWTSHDVVNRVRRILGQRSVGHLGTLDPLATGVLPLVTGGFTRLAQFYTASEKSYEGVIRFGFATTTYDVEGEREPAEEAVAADAFLKSPELNLQRLRELSAEFTGVIEQMPPPFSAKKIHGVPAYKLARKHKEVELKAVKVEIKEFEISEVEGGRARFHARVSSGTYMRSVAHDLGRRVGCGAHLESLRRTAVAEFEISKAHPLEAIEKSGEIEALFVHPRELLPKLPSVTADEATTARIRNGRPVNLPELSRARQVKVFAGQSELLAIATRVAGSLFHPGIVFVREMEKARF